MPRRGPREGRVQIKGRGDFFFFFFISEKNPITISFSGRKRVKMGQNFSCSFILKQASLYIWEDFPQTSQPSERHSPESDSIPGPDIFMPPIG